MKIYELGLSSFGSKHTPIISDPSTMFQAEIPALLKALIEQLQVKKNRYLIIFTDSQAALQSMCKARVISVLRDVLCTYMGKSSSENKIRETPMDQGPRTSTYA